MAANPMQTKARNAFLLGVIVMLIISMIIGAVLYFFVFKEQEKGDEGEIIAYVYQLKRDIKIGEAVTSADVQEVVTTNTLVPTDSMASKKLINGNLQTQGFGSYISKISLNKGTILSRKYVV
jgi:hypothetical protein